MWSNYINASRIDYSIRHNMINIQWHNATTANRILVYSIDYIMVRTVWLNAINAHVLKGNDLKEKNWL